MSIYAEAMKLIPEIDRPVQEPLLKELKQFTEIVHNVLTKGVVKSIEPWEEVDEDFKKAYPSYQLAGFLGRGQAGTVFLGEDDDGHPLFAIKAIHLPLAVGVGLPRRRTFLGYNRVLRKLNHPNVNPYLGWTVVQDEAQVFTAYCKQGSLAHMIPEGGIKDSNLIKKWTRQILEGLCYLHSHGIVHRDIKPGNILIHNGECRVADLGSARIQQMCCLVPHQLKLSGTPAFTCPEAVVSKIIQEKQGEDIWGLGCILYQMVTGLEPFHDRDNIFTIYYELGQRFSDPTLPHPLDVPGLSPDLKDLVDQCLEFDPIKRPSAFSLRKHRYFN